MIDVSTILFKLINFGALIALGVYLFRKLALSDIQLHIVKREQKIADLSLQNQLLKEQAKAMDITLADQQSQGQELLKKIDLWQSFVAHQLHEAEEENHTRELVLSHKVKMQHDFLQLADAQRKALLPAIDKARGVLAVRYQAVAPGQAYMNEIMHYLEKK